MIETPARTRLATVTARCISAQDWRDAWTDGASWPTYTLEISVDGQPVGQVEGWHFYSPTPAPPDGGVGDLGRPHDEDALYCGLPQPYDSDGYLLRFGYEPVSGVTIEPGDNLDGELSLPTHAPDGSLYLYSPGELIRAIQSAADSADHGPDPDLADAPLGGRLIRDIAYKIQDFEIQEVELSRYKSFPCEDDEDGEDQYLIVATRREDTGEWLNLDIDSDDLFEDQFEAQEYLIRRVVAPRLEELSLPPGLSWRIDEDLDIIVYQDGSETTYCLSTRELATVCQDGWDALVEVLAETFGQAVPSSIQQMNHLVAELDPFVGVEDSLRAGNCRSGSEAFAHQMASVLGADGPVGAVRASAILAVQDDAYTRRACRQAALRALSRCG